MFPSSYTPEQAHEYMGVALEQARMSFERHEVTVGCCYVDSRSGEIIAAAGNETNIDRLATRHCEFVAFDQIWAQLPQPKWQHWEKMAPHIDLFVTCEPCIMCAGAIMTLGIGRVIFGCVNDRFGGCGSILQLNKLNDPEGYSGVETFSGLRGEEAIALLQKFYDRGNLNAPSDKRKRPIVETNKDIEQ